MNPKILLRQSSFLLIALTLSLATSHAQTTNLIDFQIGAVPYGSYTYTNTSGAAVLGGTNDTWNQLVGTWSSSSGSVIVYSSNLFYANSSANLSGVTLSAIGNAYTAVGALPAGASPAFTATNGAPATNASGTPTPNLPALYSAGTTTLYYHDGGGLSDVSFSFSNLSNEIGDNFILEMYTASTVNTSLSGGVNGGNTGNALIAGGADQNINKGSGDAYVQYSGTITGNGFTFDAANYGLWNTALVGGQLELITPPSVTSYLWSNAPSDGNLANGANWAGNFGPTNGNGVQLNFATSSITNVTNDFLNGSFGSVNFPTNANAYTINGNGLTLYSGLTNSSSKNQVINANISGPGIVHEQGTGTLILNGTNNYTGDTTVEAGDTILLNGSLSNSLIVNSGAFIEPSNGTITGGAGFNQIGTGTATLAGNNSFQGQLMISSGTVILSGNNSNRPGGTNFSTSLTGGTLQLQATPANTVGGISHALSAEASAGGAPFAFENATLQLRSDTPVTFAGGNNFSVLTLNTSINFDVDQLTPGHSNNTITFAPGGFQIVNTTINVTGSNDGYTLAVGNLSGFQNNDGLNLNANGANLQVGAVTNNSFLNVGGTGNTTITGTINGFGGPGNSDPLTKNGTGTLTLSGNNTYTGVTYVDAGTLVVNNTSGSAVGSVVGQNAVYVYPGATLGGNGTIGCPVQLNGNLTPGIAGNGSSLLTVGNLNFGSAAITTLALLSNGIAGVNYDAIRVTNGVYFNGSLDIVMNSIALGTFNLFGAGSYNGDFSNVSLLNTYTNSFADNGGIWTYTNSGYSWLFNTQSGNLTVSSVNLASFLWSNAPVDGNWANGANWAGSFGPSINSQLIFGPTSIATVTNNFSGGTFSGLTFNTNASAYTVNGNPITIYQGITNNSSNNQIINAKITGGGGVSDTGTGTLILTGTNNYSGPTTIASPGALLLSGSLSNSTVIDSGIFTELPNGSLSGSAGITQNGGTVTLAGSNNLSAGVAVNSGNFTETTNGTISGTVGISASGSNTVVNLAGNNSFSGQLMIASNSTVILSGNNAGRPGTMATNTYLNGGTLELLANTNNVVNGISYALSGTNAYSTQELEYLSGTLELLSDSNITFAGGNNAYLVTTGTTFNAIVDGQTPGISNNTIGFATDGLQVANTTIIATNARGTYDGYTLAMGVLNARIGGFDYPLTLNASGANLQINGFNNGSSLTVEGSNNTTITGPVIDTGGITMAGSGTLTLTPGTSNNYTGGNTIGANGTLLGDTTSIQGSVSDNGNLIYSLMTNGIASSISGSGALTVNGVGTLTVNGNNTYSGGTILHGPTVAIGPNTANSPLGSGRVSFASNGTILSISDNNTILSNAVVVGTGVNATFNAGTNGSSAQDELILKGGISGPGSVTYTATQTHWITLVTADESYSGGTILNGGIVQWLEQGGDPSTAFGTGPITVAASTILRNLYIMNVTNSTTINSGVTLTLTNPASNYTYTYSGGISGPGSLAIGNVSGSVITLAGTNTFTGSTLITSGTLILSGTLSGSTNLNIGTLVSQGTLDASANSLLLLGTNQTLSGYGTVNTGSGTLTVSGSLSPGSMDGTTRGEISVLGSLALGSNAVTTLTLTTNGTAGTDYDGVSVFQNFGLNGALDLVVTNTPSAGTYDLFNASNFSGDWKSVTLYGTWNPGSFTENAPDLWIYSDPTYQWMFNAGNGQLTVSPVPEPSAYALLGLGVLALLLVRQKRLA